eukprot:3363155-Rhodomonas_salina.1
MSANITTDAHIRSMFRMALARPGNGGYIRKNEEQTIGAFIEDIINNWPKNKLKRTNYIVNKAINEWKTLQFAIDAETKTHLLQTIQNAQNDSLCGSCARTAF